jgi:EmrB/QacA subfamily drug resistance transporter
MIASARRKWFALGLLLGVQFMVVLDIAIVNVALPSIQTDLGFSRESLQWVVSAYALFFGGFLLLGGRVSDIVGRRRVFVAGLIVFTGASLLSGLAWSEGALIVSRSLQGLGAAMITPAALSILSTTFAEGKERNAALGAWGAVGAFGAVAGVLLGGVLTDWLSWEWIFFVNIPVGVAGLVLAPILLNESRDARVKSFDVPGAVLVTSGLVVLVFALTRGNHYGWGSIETIGLFTAAAALLGSFLLWESRTAEPLMPFSIWRLRTVAGANVAGLILGTALFAMFLGLTLYMQQVLGYSPMRTGIGYLAVAARRSSGRRSRRSSRSRRREAGARGEGWRSRPRGSCSSRRCRSAARTSATSSPGFLLISIGWASRSCRSRSRRLGGVQPAEAGSRVRG